MLYSNSLCRSNIPIKLIYSEMTMDTSICEDMPEIYVKNLKIKLGSNVG